MDYTIEQAKAAIERGKTYLGIEFGSTRIKAVLIDETHAPIASGSHAWENRLVGQIWTYGIDDIWNGLRACYADLVSNVRQKYGVALTRVGALGFSAMMHGYMAFDRKGELLSPFRTWRNTMTGAAAEHLTELFQQNIPQRWSIAHLYQSILNNEEHVSEIDYLTTLSGYIHWKLTGQKALGVGDASGMFPIDLDTKQFNATMLNAFDALIADRRYPWKLADILPRVAAVGESAGILTEEGAKLMDPSGALLSGIPVCPPEGDAGTGMTATNSVAQRTGNVSAGTSIFAMIVLEKALTKAYPEIDLVTTPAGDLVAMVHCNNGTSDLDGWVGLFREFAQAYGAAVDEDKLYGTLFRSALEGDADCGGLMAYNYLSGEHITKFTEGRPLFVRTPNSSFSLANFMRTHLYSMFATLRTGMNILLAQEHAQLDNMTGHGGFFKVEGVGQRVMAAALDTPVTIMETAGEGGPWGMALLVAYMMQKQPNETLPQYLNERVFANSRSVTASPDQGEAAGFDSFLKRFQKGLEIERVAVGIR